MPFSVAHDSSLGLVTVTFEGTIAAEDLLGSSARCFALQKQTGCLRFLIESADWDFAASLMDVHALPSREYPKAELDRRSRIAIVRPNQERALQAARFYEDACRNRGWNALIQPDRAAALAWLQAGPGR